jgi:FAD/FMN-containing dehydrogenase
MGHIGDGRISLRLPGTTEGKELAEVLIGECATAGYRCSREHGIGRIKKQSFRLLCPGEAEALAVLKTRLDPAGHINPRVLLE